MTDEEWEPGDPLYRIEDHRYSRYLFNFRDDHPRDVCREGGCPSPDEASWPEPKYVHKLPEADPLEAFINECREAAA